MFDQDDPFSQEWLPPLIFEDEEESLPDVLTQSLSLEHPVKKFVLKEGSMDIVRINKLKTLLLENPYRLADLGYEEEEELGNMSGNLYKWDDLKSILDDATDEQLKSALDLLQAIEIDGYWRLVHYQYMDQLLSSLLWISYNKDWSLTSLDGTKVVKALEEHRFSPLIVRRCLELYASSTDGGRVWELDTRRVSVQFALHTLVLHPKLKVQDFLAMWANGGLRVGLHMVQGEVVVEKIGNDYWVSLPSDCYGPNLTPVFHETH